jgi:hypothetical protein
MFFLKKKFYIFFTASNLLLLFAKVIAVILRIVRNAETHFAGNFESFILLRHVVNVLKAIL